MLNAGVSLGDMNQGHKLEVAVGYSVGITPNLIRRERYFISINMFLPSF